MNRGSGERGGNDWPIIFRFCFKITKKKKRKEIKEEKRTAYNYWAPGERDLRSPGSPRADRFYYYKFDDSDKLSRLKRKNKTVL